VCLLCFHLDFAFSGSFKNLTDFIHTILQNDQALHVPVRISLMSLSCLKFYIAHINNNRYVLIMSQQLHFRPLVQGILLSAKILLYFSEHSPQNSTARHRQPRDPSTKAGRGQFLFSLYRYAVKCVYSFI
jgi:hypothetical protein